MPSTTSPVDAGATTVVVTMGGASPHDVVRCLTQVVRTVPSRVRVTAVLPQRLRLEPALARRVRVVDTRGGDGTAEVAREVAQLRAVVVLPAGFAPQGAGWLEQAEERMAAQPRVTGVHEKDGERSFFFPAAVTSVDGPQSLWPDLPGLVVRRPAAPTGAGTPAQRITAVMIVKDEEGVLDACLTALRPFVDEVVLYDTGSTDGTRDIGARHGVRVVEGFWDDDFGAARNRALAHATTDWVLVVDADEVVQGSPADLRSHLAMTSTDTFVVTQVSPAWQGLNAGHEVRTTRIFRRTEACYRGALHEQVVPRPGRGPLRQSASSPAVRLVHSGYQVLALTEKNKTERNLDIARSAREAAEPRTSRWADLTADYGRSLALTGRAEECLEAMSALLEVPAATGNMVQAGRVAVPLLIERGRHEEAVAWVDTVAAEGESPGQVAVWRAAMAIGLGELDGARALLQGLDSPAPGTGGFDMWDAPFNTGSAVAVLTGLDHAQGRPESAAARMWSELHRAPETVDLKMLFDGLGAVGHTMRDLIEQAPPAFLERALRDVTAMPAETALPWFQVHSLVHPSDYRPVVAGCAVAALTDVPTALDWSLRARQLGLQGVCPLRELAGSTGRSAAQRGLAWALVAEGFGDADALQQLVELLEHLDEEERLGVLHVLQEHVPGALNHLVALSERQPATASS